ncbi:MAG: hypothetical protein RSE25_09835 [Bacteroidales bacterium]
MKNIKTILCISLSAIILCCSTPRKLKQIQEQSLSANVTIANDDRPFTPLQLNVSDTARIITKTDEVEIRDFKGNQIIMNAVKDEESGEMIAIEQLQAIVVEARFRNLAERNGEVDIAFNIIVPQAMQSPDWQIRFKPKFFILEDTLNLDEVHITGNKYRSAQLKGYELYNKFLSSIIPDSCDFVNSFCYQDLLQIFIDRNFRQLAALRTDSTIIDTTFAKSLMGVTERQAIEYYTKNWLVSKNNRKKLNKDKMYNKYIKTPILRDGVRLDSITTNSSGEIKYHYVQTIQTRKNLKKVDMVLDGSIYQQGKSIYTMPRTEPLTFYISSISAFTDNAIRYKKKIIERNAVANTAAYIDFKVGKYDVNDTLSHNIQEIGRIKENIRQMLEDTDFIVDSLIITASCSPEGIYQSNIILAKNRAYGIKQYFTRFISNYQDSVKNSVWDIDLAGADSETEAPVNVLDLIKTRSIPEEWNRLEKLLQRDTNIHNLPELQKCLEIADLDVREKAMKICSDYKYIRSVLYPYLRTVKFDFFLHRKGMVKDTIHTTEVDHDYMNGLQALQDRDYKLAIEKLRPYNDYNAAVAYVCLDYNQSALSILKDLQKSAKRDYMLAVVYSRIGDERRAVEMYLHSCEQDSSMRFRGNLDPEISILIKKYNINFNK